MFLKVVSYWYMWRHNYVSVNSKPNHPPGDPQGFAKSSCPRGRVFAPLSCPGVCLGVLGPVHMIPGQLIAPRQLTDPGVNFASVHGLTPVTVHMSISLPWGNFKRRLPDVQHRVTRLAEVTFLHVNRTQMLPWGKNSLAHAHF